ncbi:uncharacterized protein TNCV_628291 [Trichonephila clavipes]|nr:uncharacterized protein TNCV_628291 [Trichonephila clavipes]
MEVDGMKEIFQRSVPQRNAKYIKYIGDGDTKTFPELQRTAPYSIEKVECVGHIQKRMGARLRKLKTMNRGKKIIRRSTDEEPMHHFCPIGDTSWCKYQKAVATNSASLFKHKNIVPIAVMDEIKPIIAELSTPKLLKKCIEVGRKITDVVREFDIAHSVVSRLWKSFKTTGMCSRRHGGGRVRSTTPAEDRYIVLSAKRNRRTTAQQVANQFLAASGKQISRKTVARRLRGGGLYARRPVVCLPLTRQHRTSRLQWCRDHHNWTEQDWACVLFSDETRFSL